MEITREEIVRLLNLDPFSDEAKKLNEKAFKLGFEACEGKGLVLGQIGVDDSVCPENCRYCSFAISNFKKRSTESISEHNKNAVMSLEDLRDHLKAFRDAKVNGVSLMGTGALSFKKYLEMVKLAKEVLGDIEIIINYRDMTEDELQALKDAGGVWLYHTIRINEGKITDIDPDRRRNTIATGKKLGYKLMNGVEPVYEPLDVDAVTKRIVEAVLQEPEATGVCGLCSVCGSDFEGKEPAIELVQLVASTLRLAAGKSIPIGCIGGVKWVDAGSDPRERGYKDNYQKILGEVKKAKEALKANDFVC